VTEADVSLGSPESASRGLMAPVFLVRHGQTDSNLLGRYAGKEPEPLNLEGRRESSRMALVLRGAGLRAVWTSRIARARETAGILSDALEIPLREDARLDEMLLGAWEGLTEAEIAKRDPLGFHDWNTRPDLFQLPGRETLSELAARVAPVVADAASQAESVLLVTHVAVIRVIALATLGIEFAAYKRLPVPNASCFMVDRRRAEIYRVPGLKPVRSELGLTSGPVGAEP
jgi:broad specificity phosphatase PhoE